MKMHRNLLLSIAGMTLLFAGACSDSFLYIHPKKEKEKDITLIDPVAPIITVDPQGAVYSTGAAAVPITVEATVNDKGTLSYQWYSNVIDHTLRGTLIPGATNPSYIPPTNEGGILYYFVVITNTLNGKIAQTSSAPVKIEVNNKVNAAVPEIIGQPQKAVYGIGDPAADLKVAVSVSGEGTLSYQWYSNTKNSREGGKEITGKTGSIYTPPTTVLGAVYYYVVVTNTIEDNGDGGNKSAHATSDAAKIEVNDKINAAVPNITVDPQRAVYAIDDPAIAMTVEAEAYDGGRLTYRWYRNTKNSNEGGTVISGATRTSYTPPTKEAGVMWYYVVVTNTIGDNGDGGSKTAQAISATARITVNLMPLTITGLSAGSKIYDGTTDAVVTGTAVLEGLLEGDNVTIIAGTAEFEDKNIGTEKTVTFSGWSLGGEDSDSYTLTAQPASVTADISHILIEIKPVTPAIFRMGSPAGELGRNSDETQHSVTLNKNFYMGKYEVTQEQYEAVMGINPSYFSAANGRAPESGEAAGKRPVENVTWYDAVEFCNKLSVLEGRQEVYTISRRTPASGYPITSATVTADFNKNGYRLPTEAEWEYVCRAGTTTAFNNGNNDYNNAALVGAAAWYTGNSGSKTHQVGLKAANDWGLYDMHGNVREWCWDYYGSYSSGSQTNPTGASWGTGRVRRGGYWDNPAQNLRSAYRNYFPPNYRDNGIGFRLVCQ